MQIIEGERIVLTLEERLQIVEFDLKHYKTASIKAYGDMAMEFVMYKGLTEDGVKRIMRMERTLDEHTATLHEHTATLHEHTAILHEHTALLHKQGERLDRLEAIANEHTTRFDRLETRFDDLETRFDHLETRFNNLETTLAQILARLPEKP
jgi:predicted nuclease with TOPRIM domain